MKKEIKFRWHYKLWIIELPVRLIQRLFFIALFIPVLGWGQNLEKESVLSNAESFSNQAGTIIEKKFIRVGKVKGIEVSIMRIKDLNTNLTKTALRFEYEYHGAYTKSTKTAVLDSEELEALLKSMSNIITNVVITTPTDYTEIVFKSRTGFEAGCFSSDSAPWEAFVKLKKYDSDSQVFLKTDDFKALSELISQAKTKL